ncbi:MAG: nucleotidyltransferase domain-containing protein [Bacillota bacterium]
MSNKKMILQGISRKNNIALLYLFGSQAEAGLKVLEGEKPGKIDPLTDMDVGVVFNFELPEPTERYKLFSSLYLELEELFSPYPLDLVFLQEHHSVFQANAICGRCVYFSSLQFKEDYEENILRRAADFRPFLERYYDELLGEA